MNGMCHTLDCFFGSQFDEGGDRYKQWVAIQVYRDGNPIELGRFATEEDAEEFAGQERDRQILSHSVLQDNGKFGVGA